MGLNPIITQAAVGGTTTCLVPVTDYGATTGSSDNTGAFDAAIAAAPEGSTLFIPSGTYKGSINITDRTLNVAGCGWASSIIESVSDNPALLYQANWTGDYAPQSVSAISNQTDTTWGGTNDAVICSVITSSGLAPLVGPGDRIMVVSDDQLPYSEGTNWRAGERATVLKVSGADVWTTNTLQFESTYTTNVRAAKIPDHTTQIQDLGFTAAVAGDAGGWDADLVVLRGLNRPRMIDCEVHDGYRIGFSIIGCDAPRLTRCDVNKLENDPTANRFGYGIAITSCEAAKITDCVFNWCRHGFTTDMRSTSAGNTDLSTFGGSRHATIQGCHSMGSQAAGFDTHGGSYNIEFDSCSGRGDYYGETGSGVAFQLRGRNHKIIGCQADSVRMGIYIFQEDDGSADGCRVKSFTATNCHMRGFTVEVQGGTTDIVDVHIMDSEFETLDYFEAGRVSEATVHLSNVTLTQKLTDSGALNADGALCLRVNDDAKVFASNLTLDNSGVFAGATGPRGAFVDATAELVVNGVQIFRHANSTDFTGEAGGNVEAIDVQYPFASPPATAAEIKSTISGFVEYIDPSNAPSSTREMA